jgi:hypothetical protein
MTLKKHVERQENKRNILSKKMGMGRVPREGKGLTWINTNGLSNF